jgi:hypothetical protein
MSNDSFGRAVTRTPNSDTITLSGRLSGLGATTWVVTVQLLIAPQLLGLLLRLASLRIARYEQDN